MHQCLLVHLRHWYSACWAPPYLLWTMLYARQHLYFLWVSCTCTNTCFFEWVVYTLIPVLLFSSELYIPWFLFFLTFSSELYIPWFLFFLAFFDWVVYTLIPVFPYFFEWVVYTWYLSCFFRVSCIHPDTDFFERVAYSLIPVFFESCIFPDYCSFEWVIYNLIPVLFGGGCLYRDTCCFERVICTSYLAFSCDFYIPWYLFFRVIRICPILAVSLCWMYLNKVAAMCLEEGSAWRCMLRKNTQHAQHTPHTH